MLIHAIHPNSCFLCVEIRTSNTHMCAWILLCIVFKTFYTQKGSFKRSKWHCQLRCVALDPCRRDGSRCACETATLRIQRGEKGVNSLAIHLLCLTSRLCVCLGFCHWGLVKMRMLISRMFYSTFVSEECGRDKIFSNLFFFFPLKYHPVIL